MNVNGNKISGTSSSLKGNNVRAALSAVIVLNTISNVTFPKQTNNARVTAPLKEICIDIVSSPRKGVFLSNRREYTF